VESGLRCATASGPAAGGTIELRIGEAHVVVSGAPDLATLRFVLAALRGSR
jgi:hypothetical protein